MGFLRHGGRPRVKGEQKRRVGYLYVRLQGHHVKSVQYHCGLLNFPHCRAREALDVVITEHVQDGIEAEELLLLLESYDYHLH